MKKVNVFHNNKMDRMSHMTRKNNFNLQLLAQFKTSVEI